MSERPLLAEWAENENTLRAMLAGLKADHLGISRNLLAKICELIRAIAFRCSSDNTSSNVRQGTLADQFGVSRRTVNRWLNVAEDLGLIKKHKRSQKEDGLRLSNRTEIDWDRIKNLSRKSVSTVVTKCPNRCDKMSQPLRQNVPAITYTYPTSNSLKQKPIGQEKDSLSGLDWSTPEFASKALEVVETIEREFNLRTPRESKVAAEHAVRVANGEWPSEFVLDAINETLKRRPGVSPPTKGLAKLNYFRAIMERKTSEWVNK